MKRSLFLSGILFICFSAVYSQESISVEKLRLHLHTLASDSLKGRGFGTTQGLVAANYIAEQFESAGIKPFDGAYLHPVEFRSGIINIEGNNVIGIIEGSDPDLKDEYILIGAHYDHLGWKYDNDETVIYYGADDNASGTSALMEIGRVLSMNRYRLGRSVIVAAWDGEESGLVGSEWFTEHSPVPVEKIKGVVNLDMVGMYNAHKGVNLKGIELFAGSDSLVSSFRNDYSVDVREVNNKIENRSDTKAFGNLHIPAVAVNTGMESPYHKPGDQADLIDYEGIGMISNAVTGAVVSLSNSGEVLAEGVKWKKTGSSDRPSKVNLGLRYNIGSSQQIYVDQFYRGKSIAYLNAGLFLRIRMSQMLTLQPEIVLERKGSQHSEGKFILDGVSVPVNLLITTPDNSGNGVRLFAIVGGYYSYFLGGKVGDSGIDFTTTYLNNEYGYTTGFGLEGGKMQMGMYFTRGLSGIMQDPAYGKVVHRTVSFMLGYTF